MKKLFTNISLALLIGAVIFITSCSETDPLPISKADFKVTSVAPEVDVTVQFENLSLNAASYAWDYGDGTFDTLTIDPEHIYTEPGLYTVKLTAYTQDGQKSEAIKDVEVGRRYLTGMFLISINMNDENGDPWDDDGSGPDVLYILGPSDQSSDDVGFFADSLNVGQLSTPLGISDQNLIPDDYELLNKDYVILLQEIDTEDENADPRLMFGLDFNPVFPDPEIINLTKREDGTGDMTIPFIVSREYQFLLEFVIR